MSPMSPRIVSSRIEGLQMLSARSYEGSRTSPYEGYITSPRPTNSSSLGNMENEFHRNPTKCSSQAGRALGMSSEASHADLRRLGLGTSKVAESESFVILHPILSPVPGRLDQEDMVTDLLVTDKVMEKVMDKVTDNVTDKRSDDQDQLDLPGFGGGYNSFGAEDFDATVLDGGYLPYVNGITPYTRAGSADSIAANSDGADSIRVLATAKCIAGAPPRYLEAAANAGLPRGNPHINHEAVGHGVPEEDTVPSPTRPSRCVYRERILERTHRIENKLCIVMAFQILRL